MIWTRLLTAPLLFAAPLLLAASPPPPAGARDAFGDYPATTTAPAQNEWWRLYDDPVLEALITQALDANADLRVAFANLDAARGALRGARAARLPQTTIESGLTVDGTKDQPSASSNVPTTDYDLAATASWDVDLFGRLRAGALAARADAETAQAAADGVRIAVVADTALAYVDLCGATQAMAAARAIVATQENNLRMTRDQFAAGEVSPLEVSQAASLLETSRATVPPYEAQQANARYRLATLTGITPGEARRSPVACGVAPRLSGRLPVGDGATLLTRRPDIREADRKIAAATARIGVARADLFPRLNLGGALGILTGGFAATASPLLNWTFPNMGPARAKLSQARAAERGALASWDAIVLKALRDVETALTALDAEARRNATIREAVLVSGDYARRAAARVRLGDASPLLAVDGERARASAILQQAQSDLALAQAQVTLFRALGGGWASPRPVPLARAGQNR